MKPGNPAGAEPRARGNEPEEGAGLAHRDFPAQKNAGLSAQKNARPHKPNTAGRTEEKSLASRSAGPEASAPNSTLMARILTLAVVALAVFLVVFSPLKSWMEQQQQARELAAQIAQTKAKNEALEEEIARYEDPEYISRQARERLGYVKPGETTYVVVDLPGKEKPQLTSGWIEKDTNDLPWFSQIVAGMEVAGQVAAPPATKNAK